MDENYSPARRTVLRAGGATVAGAGVIGLGDRSAARPTSSVRDTGEHEADTWQAGAARIDATPTADHLADGVWLGGYGVGRGREATGIHDGCDAKALAFAAGDLTVAVVSLDVPGIGNALVDRIRRLARSRAGLPLDHVLVGATHTHSGPDVQGLWGGVPPAYRQYLVDRASVAVAEAVSNLRPATAIVGREPAPDHASNRRGWDGTIHDLTSLQFRRSDGVVGTLVTFPAHTVVLGSHVEEVATDYAGPLERHVEDHYGGTCLFLPGVLGDASPDGFEGDDDMAAAADLGNQLGAVAAKSVDGGENIPPRLQLRTRELRVPMDNCVFRVAYDTGLLRSYYHGETAPEAFFEGLARVLEPLPGGLDSIPRAFADWAVDAVPVAINSRVSRVTLGGDGHVELITVPGEAVTRLGREVRDTVDASHWLPLGMTHDTLGYLLTRDEFGSVDGQTYEETVSMGPDTGELYLAAVQDLFGEDPDPVTRTGSLGRTCSEIQVSLGDTL